MGIEIEATSNVEEVSVDRETTATGTIDFEVGGQTREYPLHIAFCIDVSSSMGFSMGTGDIIEFAVEQLSGQDREKIEVAKAGLKRAANQLSSDDTFGIVSFNSTANIELEPTSGNATRSAESAISKLDPNGGTNIDNGLDASRRLLKKMPNEEAVEWIVLISDGQGIVPSNSRLERYYNDQGIVIQAAGIGGGYDRQQMLALAQKTQGELEDIMSPDQLEQFFSKEVRNARNVAALDAELALEPAEMTTINRDEVYYSLAEQTSVIDPEWRGENCVISLGDINQQNPPQVVFEMDILASESDIDLYAPLVEATLSTRNDAAKDIIEVSVVDPAIEPAGDEEAGFIEPDDGGGQISGVTKQPAPEFILKKISRLSQEGKLEQARSYLEENADVLPPEKYEEAKEMIDDSDVSGLSKL